MKKAPTIKTLNDPSIFHARLNLYKAMGFDFTVERTGYSQTIILEGQKTTFLNNFSRSSNLFALAAMVKKDVEASGIIIDEIKPHQIDYFDISGRIKPFPDTVINVDIKSAYLTVLKREGLITDKTFSALSICDKLTRLKAVGMLAKTKLVLKYEAGQLKSYHTTADQNLKNVFFYISLKVDEFMKILQKEFKRDFLLYWVDGIYFRPSVDIKRVSNIFKENGFLFSSSIYTDVYFYIKNNILYFEYKTDEKHKRFNIPLVDKSNKREIFKILDNDKNQLERINK